MEIISLKGPQNSGKTTTLTIVHGKLLEQSSQKSNNYFKVLVSDKTFWELSVLVKIGLNL